MKSQKILIMFIFFNSCKCARKNNKYIDIYIYFQNQKCDSFSINRAIRIQDLEISQSLFYDKRKNLTSLASSDFKKMYNELWQKKIYISMSDHFISL